MNHYPIDIVYGDTVEVAIKNLSSLRYEVHKRLFLPKRFRKLKPGPQLEAALYTYVLYLDETIAKLNGLKSKSPSRSGLGKVIIKPVVH